MQIIFSSLLLCSAWSAAICFAAGVQKLIAAAADSGNKDILQLLLSQPVFQKDKEELEEAVDHALKVAAGEDNCRHSTSNTRDRRCMSAAVLILSKRHCCDFMRCT